MGLEQLLLSWFKSLILPSFFIFFLPMTVQENTNQVITKKDDIVTFYRRTTDRSKTDDLKRNTIIFYQVKLPFSKNKAALGCEIFPATVI